MPRGRVGSTNQERPTRSQDDGYQCLAGAWVRLNHAYGKMGQRGINASRARGFDIGVTAVYSMTFSINASRARGFDLGPEGKGRR